MKKEIPESRRIHILRDSVAQKIAAGEVIDRPFSVVRELLDNSIDAGSGSIDVHIDEGGLKRIRIIDDGHGMERSDLELCYLPHATSKIHTAEDIYRLHTLGFRGEALSSIAACSKLVITSGTASGTPHVLEIRNGSPLRLEICGGTTGTTVDVADIFYSMPGRKKFLKSPGAEGTACFRTFLEKALPFPGIQFRYFSNERMKLFLPKVDIRERIIQAFPDQLSAGQMHETEAEAGRFRFKAVFSSPSIRRHDRRYIHIYVNNRRIQEYSLVQAVLYAYDEILPGGSFPVAFIFLDIDPDLVDFNIHPAKREAKIKNLPEIHHQLVHSLKEYLNREFLIPDRRLVLPQNSGSSDQEQSLFQPSIIDQMTGNSSGPYRIDLDRWKQFAAESEPTDISARSPSTAGDNTQPEGLRSTADAIVQAHGSRQESADHDQPDRSAPPPRYIGQIFNLFLIAEWKDQLYLIDQHAAHERIIYDALANDGRKTQKLLVPIDFEIESELEALLEQRIGEFAELGIVLEKNTAGRWTITHLPQRFAGMEKDIVDAVTRQNLPDHSIRADLFADLACKAAVRDGESLDTFSAEELMKKALSLPVPRCPHGRPVWLKITRSELFQAVDRT